jgi:hypothetical protein
VDSKGTSPRSCLLSKSGWFWQAGGQARPLLLAEVIAISPRCAQKGYPHEDIHLVLRGYNKLAVRLLVIQRVLVPVDIAQLRRDAQPAAIDGSPTSASWAESAAQVSQWILGYSEVSGNGRETGSPDRTDHRSRPARLWTVNTTYREIAVQLRTPPLVL